MLSLRQRLEALIDNLPNIAESARASETLNSILSEEGQHFTALSADEADWLRGHIYAALALASSPSVAVPKAREDLRTSSSPIVLAGIARLLRKIEVGNEWNEDIDSAVSRIRYMDIYPEFRFDPPATCCWPTLSCLEELKATKSHCCTTVEATTTPTEEAEFAGELSADALDAILQDQSGKQIGFRSLTEDMPLVLALFYTRCMNPLKCSLTISRLASSALNDPTFAYIGMSYDPEFDTPRRLRTYGDDRNFPYDENSRLVRCTEGWTALRSSLQIQAGYGVSTINSHARELFFVDHAKQLWRLPPDWLSDTARILKFSKSGFNADV